MKKPNPVHRAYWQMFGTLILAAIIRSQVYELHQNGGGLLSQFIPTRIHPVATFSWGNRIALALALFGFCWFVALVHASGQRKALRSRPRRKSLFESVGPPPWGLDG